MNGFKKFILRGNVVDLAVGVVIGAAFNGLVTAFVSSFFTPILGALGGIADFSKLTWQIGPATIQYGLFLNAILSFLLTAFVVYFFVVMPMNRLHDKFLRGEDSTPTTKPCPFCFSNISLKATRCPNCTSQLDSKS